MKSHILKFRAVDNNLFQQVKDGAKSIETRAATTRYKTFAPGDEVRFQCSGQEVSRNITKIHHFKSVQEVFASKDFNSILPGVSTLAEAEQVYYGFPGYKEKIERDGILAFYLEQ